MNETIINFFYVLAVKAPNNRFGIVELFTDSQLAREALERESRVYPENTYLLFTAPHYARLERQAIEQREATEEMLNA